MFCPTCGNESESDAQFCGICGSDLVSGETGGVGGSGLPRVSFPEAIRRGFSNYFNFSGRATRAEIWWWALFITLASLAFGIIDAVIGTVGVPGVFRLLFSLGTTIPSFAVGARRLHDIDKSGWWQLMLLAILVGWIILIMWSVRQGDKGPNSHGSDPRATPR